MDIDQLLAPVGQNNPCGEELEYDADFLALQEAVVGRTEQRYGKTVIPAEPPDWGVVEKLGLSCNERTKDIRIMVYLTQAWAERRGIIGYTDGLIWIKQTLEQYWEQVYPRLINDDVEDPMPRINALTALGAVDGVAKAVRNGTLIKSSYGSQMLTLRDAEAILNGSKQDNAGFSGDRPKIQADIARAASNGEASVLAIETALNMLTDIKKTVATNLGASWTPDYSGIEKTLRTVRQAMGNFSKTASQDDEVTEMQTESYQETDNTTDDRNDADSRTTGSADAWKSAKITSRKDALAMLKKVCEYMEYHEPSHPAPLLIRRTQHLMELSFYDILKNLAPASLDQIDVLIGPKHGEGEN